MCVVDLFANAERNKWRYLSYLQNSSSEVPTYTKSTCAFYTLMSSLCAARSGLRLQLLTKVTLRDASHIIHKAQFPFNLADINIEMKIVFYVYLKSILNIHNLLRFIK